MTAGDPRAPVLVGAGQVLQRAPGPDVFEGLLEPLDLMERAARIAAEDAGCPSLLAGLDGIRVPRGLWPYANPAHALKERFGATSARTALATIGGNMVQRMLTDAAREIAAGKSDAVLLVGAEAEHTKRRAKRAGHELGWSEVGGPPPDRDFGDDGEWITREEVEAGLAQPAAIFTLYENALRHARGESHAAHRDRIARLWHGFARVAERNPFAWTREAPSVETIRDATPDNRMNSWPYTKRLCANMVVDLGAAVILTSAERAARLGIAPERLVHLHAATDCAATPIMSRRMDYLRVPTLELAGRRALELAGAEPGDFEHVDLYSCFPAAVQLAAEALGFSLDAPLTVTGGLSFAGGPFNSYVLHSIATTLERLRAAPGSRAFVSSVGGSFAKHAFAVYSTEPPAGGLRTADLDVEAAALTQRDFVASHDGAATVETWVLRYRGGAPARATFSCLLDDGRRTWATSEDAGLMAELVSGEACDRPARLRDGALLELL